MDLSGIGLRLKEIRKENHITQPVMAAAIDVSDRTYKYYEQEKRELPAVAAIKISTAFDVNLEWLLTGGDDKLSAGDPVLAELSSLAVLKENEARNSGLEIEKISKIIGFIAAQAKQTHEKPSELAPRYFDTL